MSWLGGRRRGQDQGLPTGTAPGPWGEAGPPADYDPDAETSPLELAQVGALVGAGSELAAGTGSELAAGTGSELAAGTGSELAAGTELHSATGLGARNGRGAGPGQGGRPELGTGTDLPAGAETALAPALHGLIGLPDSTAEAGAGGANEGGADPRDETLETTITELSDEMGYPREVVPSAELVATVSSGEGTELPHWADPPTGEVPSAIAGPKSEDDELQAWRLLGSRGLHWRDDVNDWSDGPGVEDLVDKDDQRNGMPEEGTGSPFSFDEDFERLEHERSGRGGGAVESGDENSLPGGVPRVAGETSDETGVLSSNGPVEAPVASDQAAASTVMRTSRRVRRTGRATIPEPALAVGASARHTRGVRAPYDVRAEGAGMGNRDIGAAIVTGIVLVVLLVVCYLIGAVALLVFSAVAIFGCAVEAFSMFQRAGFRPATLLGVVGSAGAVAATYWRGTAALPVVIAVIVCGSLVWYLARVVEARPVVNVAVTVLGFCWVGVLGSFAGLLLAAHHGSNLFLGAVVPTIAADLVAWFIGSQFGNHPLAPAVSPSKTWEGVIAGGIAALIAGAIIGNQLAPWGGARHGLELGLVVAIVAPIGDLVQSMLKRDLRVKDSGSLLPGHGGLLDRFDSLLFVLPATYFLAEALHIVVN
jgi:phosphatidate cytidylyltransferase